MIKQIHKKFILATLMAIFILLISGYAYEILADDDYGEDYEKYEDDDRHESYKEHKYNNYTEDSYYEKNSNTDTNNAQNYNNITDSENNINKNTTDANNPSYVDSDNDGIVDAKDKHPGENDFIFVKDVNKNGIVDDFEFKLNGIIRRK